MLCGVDLREQGVSCRWHISTGQQGEGAVVEDGASKVGHEWKCLCMEVAKHGFGLPAANQAYDVRINLATKQGHGSPSA